LQPEKKLQAHETDHGTAFDIAWIGQAHHTNMLTAIEYGLRLAGS